MWNILIPDASFPVCGDFVPLIRLIIDVLVIVIDKPLSLYSAGVLESEE